MQEIDDIFTPLGKFVFGILLFGILIAFLVIYLLHFSLVREVDQIRRDVVPSMAPVPTESVATPSATVSPSLPPTFGPAKKVFTPAVSVAPSPVRK
jgi:hypothetical protein